MEKITMMTYEAFHTTYYQRAGWEIVKVIPPGRDVLCWEVQFNDGSIAYVSDNIVFLRTPQEDKGSRM